MIKIKILNPLKDRNEPTFRPFMFIKNMLRDYYIDITDSNDYDFLFIGMSDFYDMSLTLNESIEWGLENIRKCSEGGDYLLFDGFDSTSITGTYEVFEKSSAKLLVKNQLLKNKDDYKNVYAYGKWWFGDKSGLDVSYDIPSQLWSKIKLSGFNLGSQLPNYHTHYQTCTNKDIDVCAIYQGYHKSTPFNQVIAPGIQYTNHRTGAWDKLKEIDSKYSILINKLPKQEYVEKLWRSKICISPFGMGEICYRDFEAMQFGTLLLKPNQDCINTSPNIYIENETYIPVKPDWSDLNETIEKILGNYKDYHYIIENFRNQFKQEYTAEKQCLHWYNLMSNLDNIGT